MYTCYKHSSLFVKNCKRLTATFDRIDHLNQTLFSLYQSCITSYKICSNFNNGPSYKLRNWFVHEKITIIIFHYWLTLFYPFSIASMRLNLEFPIVFLVLSRSILFLGYIFFYTSKKWRLRGVHPSRRLDCSY